MKNSLTKKVRTVVFAAAVGALSFGTTAEAGAAVFDVDTVTAQTTGAYASGKVNWETYYSGNYSMTLKDTACDGHGVTLYGRGIFTNGTVNSWQKLAGVSGCGLSVSTGTKALYAGSKSNYRSIQFMVQRNGVGNYDIYTVAPGGA